MESKLNICIVSREYPPETLWGGIGAFTYNLAHGLKNIGHNVDVVAFTLKEDLYTDDNGINIYRLSSPKIPFMQKTFWDFALFALSPFAFVYSIKIKKKIEQLNGEKNYDVIDFPEHIGEGFFTIMTKKYPTLVRLFTPLSLIGHMGLNKTTNSLDYYLFGLMEKLSIKKSTIVNSPSNNLAELVKEKFGVHRNIELIYNPIDTNKFSPKPKSEMCKDETIKVLFIGRLIDRKGVHILAKAVPKVVATVKNVKFIIIGNDGHGVDGFKSMKGFMLQVFRERGVMGNVEFIDQVPYNKLPEFYNDADISVVPSLYDNSPYTCLEAMSCGLPVIGTSAGGMPEYIDNGENGIIIPPDNVDALAKALTELLLDYDKRRRYGNIAREKAVRVFNREVVAKKITDIYLMAISLFNDSGKRDSEGSKDLNNQLDDVKESESVAVKKKSVKKFKTNQHLKIKNSVYKKLDISDISQFYHTKFAGDPRPNIVKYDPASKFDITNVKDYWIYNSIEEGTKVLDVGCGSGTLNLLKNKNVYLVGVDFSEKALEKALKVGYDEVVSCDIFDIPYPDNYFDNVVSLDVLGHIENEVKDIYISEWTRLLKEDGTALHGIESDDIDYSNLSEEVKENIIIDGHVGLESPSKIKERFMQFYKEVTLENCMGLCYNWYDIQKYQTTEQSIGKELRDYLLTFNPDQIRAFNSAMLLIRNRLAENNQLNDSGGFVFIKARNRISK